MVWLEESPLRSIRTMPSNSLASFTRIGRRNCSFTSPKMAVFAPMPRPSVNTATTVKTGVFINWRSAYLTSFMAERLHRIDCGRTACREVDGEQRDEHQYGRHDGEGDR